MTTIILRDERNNLLGTVENLSHVRAWARAILMMGAATEVVALVAKEIPGADMSYEEQWASFRLQGREVVASA